MKHSVRWSERQSRWQKNIIVRGLPWKRQSSRLYVSEEYLSTQFKKETQSSFTETVRKFRIEKIKDLLLNSKFKIKSDLRN